MSPTAFIREELSRACPGRPTAVTIGKFDGVHRGHQYLISELIKLARKDDLSPIVVTFNPHPVAVLEPGTKVSYLCPLEERIDGLHDLGVDSVAVLSFTSQVAQLSAHSFLALLVEELDLKLLMVGPDFTLGRRREGNIERIRGVGKKMQFKVEVVPILSEGEQKVGSAAIRVALAKGDMEVVSGQLGRLFSLSGPIVTGAKRGRTIDFPTANVGVSPDLILPAHGIYVTWAHVGGERYRSVTNIGIRPTFDEVPRPTVETYILDFDGDIYGEEMKLDILHCLRPEEKFDSVKALVEAIKHDVQSTEDYFNAQS